MLTAIHNTGRDKTEKDAVMAEVGTLPWLGDAHLELLTLVSTADRKLCNITGLP